jgi:hypothetical protein
MLDQFRPLQEQIDAYRSIQEQFERVATLPVQAYLEELTRTEKRMQQLYPYRAVEEMRLALERAVSPLMDFASLVKTYDYQGAAVREAFQRLNLVIAEANYLGKIEIGEEGEEEDEQTESSQSEAFEEQLIEVVSAEVFEQLKRVDFVPLRTLDRILRSPEAMRMLGAREFEQFIATLVDQLGFEDVVLTPRSGDRGRDVIAIKKVHGIVILFAFECKRYRPDLPVGPELLRALLGTITHGTTKANKGVLVTTSTFTSGARNFLLTEPSIDGKDFDGIVAWLQEYAKKSI